MNTKKPKEKTGNRGGHPGKRRGKVEKKREKQEEPNGERTSQQLKALNIDLGPPKVLVFAQHLLIDLV